ncbi:MAG: permease [Oscillospiraceae bacterium]|nr:permease [Oscillospiraceae bacterium]
MSELLSVLKRESIYIWYYFSLQLRQILPYWILGMVIGSVISVFVKDRIHGAVQKMGAHKLGVFGIVIASLLGIASPLCMYGTIPLAASFSRKGIRDDWLAAFMMSSILLNPQLIIYSMALGKEVLAVRLITCFLCGIASGLILRFGFRGRQFFDFSGFEERKSRDTDPNLLLRLLKNIGRNFKATGGYFLVGVLLSALFQRYVPAEGFAKLFGKGNEGFGLLMAATVGVPLYACGGGTIPLLQQWLASGMSVGSAASFMLTGPATKITNLGALKIVLGVKHFILYLAYVMIFSLLCGFIVNLIFV